MPTHSRKKQARHQLWEQDPRCHWCGRETKLREGEGNRQLEPTDCTLDHLYTRFDELRFDCTPNQSRHVIACYECNWKRGRERQQAEQRAGNPAAFDSDSEVRTSIIADNPERAAWINTRELERVRAIFHRSRLPQHLFAFKDAGDFFNGKFVSGRA